MRKTLSIIVLALGLVFTAVPVVLSTSTAASAATVAPSSTIPDTAYCDVEINGHTGTPCPPVCQAAIDNYKDATNWMANQLARKINKIYAQQDEIRKLKAELRQLRADTARRVG